MTGGRRLSATRTQLKFCSTPMAVVLSRVGGLSGVSTKSQSLFCCYSLYLTGVVGKNGVLTSPNYPQAYPNHHFSTQPIEVAEGKTIRFSWTHFDTEPDHDYVRILDSNENNLGPKLFDQHRLFGSREWDPIPSIGANYSTDTNSLQVEFRTDGSGQGMGWKLKWTEQ